MFEPLDNPFDYPVNTTPIQQLQAMPIYGNGHDDAQLFLLADFIACDETELFENRIAALRVIDQAMGNESTDLDDAESAAKALADYIRQKGGEA